MTIRACLFLLAFTLLFSPGCWNRVELDQRAIAAGFGADRAGDGGRIRITVQVIRPGQLKVGQAKPGGSAAVTVYSCTGYTFFDALRNLAMATGKKIFIAEAKVVVIGEGLAREGIGKITDMYDRDHEMSTRNFLLIARGEAREVMETNVAAEKIWAYGIAHKVKSMAAHGKAPPVEFRHFLNTVESKTTAPVAAAVRLPRIHGGGEEKGEDPGTIPPKEIMVSGAAVFRRYKLAGWLNEKETRGLLWVAGRVKSGIVPITAPGGDDGLVSLEIISAGSKVRPEIAGGKPSVTVEIRAVGSLGDIQPDTVDITDPGIWNNMEKRKAAAIEGEIRAAVAKAQALNADIFGFGEALRRQFPKEWKSMEYKWDEIFPGLPVNIKVDAKIRGTMKVTKPAGPGP